MVVSTTKPGLDANVIMCATERPWLPRICVLLMAMMHVLVSSGIVYGWAALCPLLHEEGFFSEAASPPAALSVVGTLGIGANALCKLPLGIFLDTSGPRRTSMVGGILLTAGALLLGLGDRNSSWQIGVGYFCIGVAGPFVQVPCFQFAELFGDRKGTAISTLVVCFELSTGGFAMFHFLCSAGVRLVHLFVGLAAAGMGITVTAAIFWPDEPNRGRPKSAMEAWPHREILKKAGFWVQVKSDKFKYLLCYMTIHILRQGYMLVTVDRQSHIYFGREMGVLLGDAFSIILPLGFLPMAMFTASGQANALLKRSDLAFLVASGLSILWLLLMLVHQRTTFVAAFIIFPFARQLVFSAFFAYSAATFGYATFGRITGIVSTLAGVVQLLVQQLLPLAARFGWMGAPLQEINRWTLIDFWMCLLPLPLLLWPAVRIQRRRRQCVEGLGGDEVFSPAEILLS